MMDGNLTSDGELEYTGLMARAWDPLRGDTSDWPDRALFRELIAEIGEPVLDVGCGTGRLLLDFLADGVDVDGIEISGDMLALLRAKAAAAGLVVEGRIHEGAMETMDLPRRYRLVLVPSSSFQLLVDPHVAAEAMRRFHGHLLPGGTLVMPWIDLAQDHPDGADDVFEDEAALPDGSVIRRWCRSWYDPASGLESTDDRYQLLRDGHVVAEERKVREPAVRHYSHDAIEALHRAAGFDAPTLLAEFTREPARGGERIVTSVARRAG
ncbi:MAG: class I SAM-dependent methyltransferase [Candidatus Limnocylindrales bacterium]